MAWRCGRAWQPLHLGRTVLPRPPRILAASPVAWSADAPQGVHWTPFSIFERLTSPGPASMLTAASSDTASHTTLAPPLPGASLQNSLQNNIISRPRHYTLGHAADPGSLTPAQLRHAAKMARLSGLAYKQGEELAELLSREGLSLVARGQSHFTRWYVADVLADEEDATPDKAEAGPAAERNSPAEPASSRRRPRQRVVMMRGVVWRSGDFTAQLWADMMRFWPAPFEGPTTQPRETLVAHAGMADMAEALLQELRPYLVEARTTGQDVAFGGHSLGGAFALLMACSARVRLQLAPAKVGCYAFGSPPVLARADKGDGRDVLQIVGLPAGAVRSFVLDNDPVPRAMLSVDPTFALIKDSRPVSWLLEARRRLLGDGAALTPERFLYENVGEVYLIRWSPESGQQVRVLAPAEVEAQLRMAMEEIVRTPAALLQALLDHSHGSYAQELWAAARQLEQRTGAPRAA